MIVANPKDPNILALIEGLNDLKVVKTIDGARDMHVYSVAAEREISIAIPAQFPESRHLVDTFTSMGLTCQRACFWGMAESLNYNVLGIGFNFKKSHPQEAKKAIICAYLTLNKRIKLL